MKFFIICRTVEMDDLKGRTFSRFEWYNCYYSTRIMNRFLHHMNKLAYNSVYNNKKSDQQSTVKVRN
jgi:hypothetical protein